MGRDELKHLGDLLKAVTRLEAADPVTCRAIAGCLGIRGAGGMRISEILPPKEPSPKIPGTRKQERPTDPPMDDDFGLPRSEDFAQPDAVVRIAEGGTAVAKPHWFEKAAPFDIEPREVIAEGLEWESLIQEDLLRDVLLFSVRTQEEDGLLDVPRLVEGVACRRSIEVLPRSRISSTRRGVQVLVDRGASMALFRRDQLQLTAGLEALLGTHRVEVVQYTRSPLRKDVKRRDHRRSQPYALPTPGTPILILGDLGLGPGSLDLPQGPSEAWPHFARSAAANGNTVIVLAPVPASRGPSVEWPGMTRVYWHDALTPKHVLTLFGRGHEGRLV